MSSKVDDGWKVGLSDATGAYEEYLWGGGGGGGESLSEFGEAIRLSAELRLSQLFNGASMPDGGGILIGSAWNVRFSERSERPAVSRGISGDSLRLKWLNMSSSKPPKFRSPSSFGGTAVLA